MAFYLRWKKKVMSFNSPLCKDATKQGPFTKDTIANRDAIQRSCFSIFDILNESQVPFRYRVKGQSGEWKWTLLLWRQSIGVSWNATGSTVKRSIGALTKRYTPLRYTPALQRDIPLPPRRLDNDKQYPAFNSGYSRKPYTPLHWFNVIGNSQRRELW